MSFRKPRTVTLAVVALLVAILCAAAAAYAVGNRLPEKLREQDTLILGQSRLIPGAPGVLLVQVMRHDGSGPVPGAEVRVALRPQAGGPAETLFTGTTGEQGSVAAAFTVPDVEQAAQQIVVETRSRLGRDTLEQPVTVQRSYKLLLTTDKPIYQPGQQILIRALAVNAFDRTPIAAVPVELTVADAKGNKVFRQAADTSGFGVSAWSFRLADEVNHGNYKISATLGDTTSEKTVAVQPYVLPKFRVSATPDAAYYRPGERVTGQVTAAYFFGKPVDGGEVRLSGWVYDVERRQALDLAGRTDAQGRFSFEFDLPPYLVTSAESGLAEFILEAAVTDGAAHTEQVSIRIPVAQQGILVEAVPESRPLKPGLENILYLMTAYPDGSPAECDVAVTIGGVELAARTGAYGLGEVRLTPDSPDAEIYLRAADALGHTGEATVVVEGRGSGAQVLLRPERAVYRVGETMNLEVLTTEEGGSVYLDLIREGQTLSTRALDVRDGRAAAAVDLTPDLYGTLTLHAYRPLLSGDIVRDTRLVVVDAADELALKVQFDRDTYRPGERAALQIGALGQDGQGVAAALGLAIVDESVFALQEQDPGFAKLYFLLEKELLEPQFDLHGVSLPEMMGLAPAGSTEQAQSIAAKASLASIAARLPDLSAGSHAAKVALAADRQQGFFRGLATALYAVLLLVPLAGALVLGAGLARERVLGRSLLVGVGLPLLLLGLTIAWLLWAPLPGAPWADTPGDRLEYLLGELGPTLLCVAVPLAAGGLIGVVALAVRAARKAELPLGVALLLLAAYLVLLAMFGAVLDAGDASEPAPVLVIAFAVAFLALPLAFGARAAGFGFQRQRGALVASGLVALLVLAGSAAGLFAGALASARLGHPAPIPEVLGEWDMALAAATAAPAALPPSDVQAKTAEGDGSAPEAAPLLRQFFPETMYWEPDAVTDAAGHWQAELDLAHTITTWRLTALASAQDGRIGSATAPLRVFQDFFVDIDLPLALTQGDEVSMPVAVYNYLEAGQRVQLSLEPQEWFESLGEPEQAVEVAAGDVSVVYFPIRVTAVEGRFRPVVTALGDKMSDATTLRHDVQVVPNGKRFDESFSDRLSGNLERTVTIPAESVPGTAQILVKIYPGVVSQVVEGLEALLRMPDGCFEQTSSLTYPDVLVLDYLKSTGQASPEVQMRAEEYVNLGYQRLTTFEVDGGGFSLFGEAPADRMLTAYGLQEFGDMARVHPVDQAMIDRAAQWLLSQQQPDGSWENDQGLVHESSWSSLGNERLPVTAYVVWSLIVAGFEDEAGTLGGLAYVQEFWPEAEDAYTLALAANALVAGDPAGSATQAALDRLAGLAVVEGETATWSSGIATFMGATGQAGSIETTALAAYAFLRAGQHTDLAGRALTGLIQQKDSYGTWYSTQATILTLKALLLSATLGGEGADATVRVSLNGEEADPIRVDAGTFDVVQLVSFTDRPVLGDNHLRIAVEGRGSLMVQVSSRYYLPWDRVPAEEAGEAPMQIAVSYDRTELAVSDTVEVTVRVALREGAARQAIVDLGVPPGFEVVASDLADLVARHSDRLPGSGGARFSRFDLTGRQIVCYLEGLKAGEPLEFRYRLRARYPIKALTPASMAYDYYNPGVSGVSAPEAIQVTE